MPNRLSLETSPYLLQHKNNPVDWFPWSQEALTAAKVLDKPILLSIGYSACHWCHVMERESFENAGIAVLMNENFINIKVDREERPDLDSIYMSAVQSIAGHGGWPLTVFLTPEGKPFHGGTYFPPVDRQGMPGFPKVLEAVSNAYKNQREQIESASDRLVDHIKAFTKFPDSELEISDKISKAAYEDIESQVDMIHGGLKGAPKFPQPMIYEFLLKHHARTNHAESLSIVTKTLDKMAYGGIYDHLGGGFHRYSTDAVWLVPHFEKMLYDNALLVRLYLHAYQITGKDLYKNIVEETLAYVMREMTSVEGAFFSSQDADSDGIEGQYFVWTVDEIQEILDPHLSGEITKYYDVSSKGNFEGKSILNLVSQEYKESKYKLIKDTLIKARDPLLKARGERVCPETDNKILTAWNGLMISAFAEASIILNNQAYADTAEKSAKFLLNNLMNKNRLLRTFKDGKSKLNGYLEDYAFFIEGLLELHETTLNPSWLNHAVNISKTMIDLFWDIKTEQFYDTSGDHEDLVIRPRDIADNAIPSGASTACKVLLKLAVYLDDDQMRNIARLSMESAMPLITKAPIAAGEWLNCIEFHIDGSKEIVINGDFNDHGTKHLLSEVYRSFVPNKVILGINEEAAYDNFPLAASKNMLDGKPTAYVCKNYTCSLPVNEPTDLFKQLTN
ncbi:MAG: thioredoxin domain-containing protein [SAR202 cluster bacterium]|nr:thioredoxin domain-containing protein [SAR202 cluster bacterium]|tara:strand:+ start:13623 stop:15650 length:2028 start_codon:yes stop_codon:yes gene_type:complete